jgi:hypothetical protein
VGGDGIVGDGEGGWVVGRELLTSLSLSSSSNLPLRVGIPTAWTAPDGGEEGGVLLSSSSSIFGRVAVSE